MTTWISWMQRNFFFVSGSTQCTVHSGQLFRANITHIMMLKRIVSRDFRGQQIIIMYRGPFSTVYIAAACCFLLQSFQRFKLLIMPSAKAWCPIMLEFSSPAQHHRSSILIKFFLKLTLFFMFPQVKTQFSLSLKNFLVKETHLTVAYLFTV